MSSARTTLECPCCGSVGATSDEYGLFHDGQELECGCAGQVTLDAETPADIMIADEFDPTAACDDCAGKSEGL